MKNFFRTYKKGLIIGFILGALVFPALATLGLITHFFEYIRPLLIGPMDLISGLIPNRQLGPNSFEAPAYKWIVTLGFNGICYALLGALIQAGMKAAKKEKAV